MEIQDYEHKRKPNNRNSKKIKALLVVFCVLIVAISFCIYQINDLWENSGDGHTLLVPKKDVLVQTEQNAFIDSQDGVIATTPPDGQQPGAYDFEYNGKKYVRNDQMATILFLGIDTDTERKINMEGYRSDMVLVCAIDVDHAKVTLISIPRDTYTTVYKLDKDTGEITETLQDKINAAYSYGRGANKWSYTNAMNCVQMFLERTCKLETPLGFSLDIPVQHYAGIDMDGIEQIASAVGGVVVTLERDVPGVGSKGQTVTLKYRNAEEYVRVRHDAGGDIDRARRQQKFMVELARTIKQKGSSDLVGTALDLYDDVIHYVNTSFYENTDQIIDLAKLLMRVDVDAIDMITVPTTGKKISGKSYEFHDEQATLDILLSVYYHEVP